MENPDSYATHRVPRDGAHQFRGQHIISDQITREGLGVVWRELEGALERNIPGDIVEFGCYAGTTSLFIRRLLDERGESDKRTFHVYDSFAGLPPKSTQDQSAAGTAFQAGALSVSEKELLHQFRRAGLQKPIVHKGWFDQLSARDVPERIAFAFLDGDFYSSILTSLKLVWPCMAEGGRLLVDDYQRETLPGAARAVTEFLRSQGKEVHDVRHEHNIAIIEV